jgi:hypothetical protein
VLVGSSSHFSIAAHLLMWARSGVLPPAINVENGSVIAQLMHLRGPLWQLLEGQPKDAIDWRPATGAPHKRCSLMETDCTLLAPPGGWRPEGDGEAD